MFNFKDETYVVLEFLTIDGHWCGMRTKRDNFEVHSSYPIVIEVGAVKIRGGKIIEHYSTFAGIDGCDEYDLKFDEDSPEFKGITAEHLIGAPSFFDVANYLFKYITGCTVITKYSKNDSRNAINLLKNYMKDIGYVFNNPLICLNNLLTAVTIKDRLGEVGDESAGLDCYKIALALDDKESYDDAVAGYLDIDPDRVRQDSLSRALIMARLFIELIKGKNELQPIDEEIPF